MNKNIIYIVGAVALLGGGVFIFLKKKNNKDKDKLALAELQKLGGVPLSTATIGSNSSPEEEVKKLEVAKGIATELNDLRKAKEPLKAKFDSYATSSNAFVKMASNKLKQDIDAIDKKMETLNTTLKAMGFSESNGNILKIK
jgi:LPXTG-motif cell wall-anchored protein